MLEVLAASTKSYCGLVGTPESRDPACDSRTAIPPGRPKADVTLPQNELPLGQVNPPSDSGTRLEDGTAIPSSVPTVEQRPADEQQTQPGPGPDVDLLDEEMQTRTAPATGLEADLRLALEAPVTQFVLHYQPVMDLTSGKVVGVESLARWQHPVFGLLGPNQFIALAEETGLIRQLGDWALAQAVRDMETLTHDGREIDVAVNFSAMQLDEDVVAKVQRALESSGVRPGRLTVEMTESAFVKDEGITATTYQALSQMGIKFAVDDFGTSFSSLLHLRLYPIDTLKIDGKFVAGIGERSEDEAICDRIIGLAAAVGASTVGEGIETTQQYAVLRSMGCQRGQGFLWSPAVPIDELDDAFVACERVSVPERGTRLPRVSEGLSDEVTTLIARLHGEGASTHAMAAELNRSFGRHFSGVRWTAGAVARTLPAATGSEPE